MAKKQKSMKISDLVTEQDNNRLSKGAIMAWLTFAIAVGYWITSIYTMKTIPMPDGLMSFLLAILGYNAARRGTDKASAVIEAVKNLKK